MNTNLTRTLKLSPILAALLAHPMGCATADEPSEGSEAQPRIVVARPYSGEPSGAGSEDVGTAQEALNGGHVIGYQGGHVMSGTVNVYYIWYGNWSGNSATSILTDFANNIGNSPYYNINELYDDNYGGRVTGAVRLLGTTTD